MNNKKICIICNEREIKGNYSYCKQCYSEYQKNYREGHKGYYLYVVLDESKKVLYVGATEKIYQRISAHINGHSNIKNLMLSNNWSSIKYLNITNLVKNREEMLLLENSLIELYNTDWNDKKNIIKNIDKLREFELLAEIHSLNKEWSTYCENEHKKMLL